MIGKAQVTPIQSLKINESKNKERNLKKNMDMEGTSINITPSNILEEFLVLQNIHTSNNPDSNFELYDTRINGTEKQIAE